jgi:acetyl-CoA C-acetyltransferase
MIVRNAIMPNQDPIVIASIARTPIGGLLGDFSAVAAAQLGGFAIRAAVDRAQLSPDQIDEAIIGCVLSAGQGQAPARQAALAAGLPIAVGATTVNKMCGSGMKAVMLAHDLILAGSANIMVAGGMESMSRAPYLIDRMRGGIRMGHSQIQDHMFLDGLEDAYDKGKLMGWFADSAAIDYELTRVQQDDYALRSLDRALKAANDGFFDDEIIPVTISDRGQNRVVAKDEQLFKATPEKITTLKPAFRPDGTVTAANASSISDGAAAIVLMRQSQAEKAHLPILAHILAHASHAQEPANFASAPVQAIKKLLNKINWSAEIVDLYEINEAFAIVPLIAIKALGIPPEKVNCHGGACALGHPIGASGARIIVTLVAALARYGLRRGVASLCIGGGEAVAVAIELP